MQIYYQSLAHDPLYVAWVQCETEDIPRVREVFPEEEYDLTLGVKSKRDALTCPATELNNPAEHIWGLDVWKKISDGRCEGLSTDED